MPPSWYPDPAAPGLAALVGRLRLDRRHPPGPLRLARTDSAGPTDGRARSGRRGSSARQAQLPWWSAAWYTRSSLLIAYVAAVLARASGLARSTRPLRQRLPADPPNFAHNFTWVYVVDVPLLPVAISFMMWLRRAAEFARRAGLPAARDPMWAVLGFFVPIVNFWFPYQVARDLFPPGHPGRRLVGRWWASWIVLGVAVYPLWLAAIFSTVVSYVVAAVACALAAWAAVNARAMITACGPAHAALLGH